MRFQSQLGQTKVDFNNQGKNAPQCFAFWLENFLFKIEIACGKKLKQCVATSLKVVFNDLTFGDLMNCKFNFREVPGAQLWFELVEADSPGDQFNKLLIFVTQTIVDGFSFANCSILTKWFGNLVRY